MEVKILSQHYRIPKKINLIQEKKRLDILVSFIPDEVLRIMVLKETETVDFTGVVLLIDIHELTEIDRKTTQEELFKANATTNAYLSAIIEIIHYYNGDIQDFTPTQLIVIWKCKLDSRLYSLIDDIVLCAMNIKKILNNFNVEMKQDFKIKQIISCGNLSLRIIGDKLSKSWVVEGSVIHDCQVAKTACNSRNIFLSANAWGHLFGYKYDVQFTTNGLIEVIKRNFQPDEKEPEKKYKSDGEQLWNLCSEHLKFRNTFLDEMKIQCIITRYSSHINDLVRVITPRNISKSLTGKVIAKDLELFMVKHVTDKVREHQPLEYLTEVREATVQKIFVGVINRGVDNWFNSVNEVYCAIQKIASEKFGCIVNRQICHKQTIIFDVGYGLHTNTEINYSQKALIASQAIIQELKLTKDLRNVNITISKQLVHTAVFGHPFRKNYFVLGSKTDKPPTSVYFKIFCDEKTYKNSKLPSNHFLLQNSGVPNPEILFEFIDLKEAVTREEITVIGRKDKLDYIENMLFKTKKADGFNAVVVKGLSKSGKSTILRKIMSKCELRGVPSAYLNLCGGKSKPYFCVSAIYRQLLDFHASKTTMPTCDCDSNQLWTFSDTLQLKNSFSSEDIRQSIKIFENFFEICKRDAEFTVVIIDNIQFIDMKSLQILEDVLKLNVIRIVTAGQFEEDKLDVLWKFTMNDNFKILHLKPLGEKFIPQLVCHFLKVQGVAKKIVGLISKVCEGRPGWIETCLLELLKKEDLQIRCIHYNKNLGENIILPNYNKKNLKTNGYVRIAIMGNTRKKNLNYITPNAIALNFFESFPPYQQIIIKTASVIGDIFTRSLLAVILELRNNSVFTYAIKCLFDEEIFECGSKYFINNAKILKNDLSCVCYMRQDEKAFDQDFPKYAFCKILHFRNRILRKIAYGLLSSNQRKDLHLKITELLEHETILCPQCSQHRSTAIIKIKTYNDMTMLLESKKSEIKQPIDIKEIKEVIKKEITDFRDCDLENENEVVFQKEISIEKFWNSSTCFCLEIFTRIYGDLVHHSQRADHLAKQIFFMYQYGSILILIGELDDAIVLLKEASQLCIFGDLEKHHVSNEFSKFIFSRIVTSIAEAYYYLDNYKAAKNYILLCFRQQDIPIISMEYKLCFKLLRRSEKSVLDEYSSKSAGYEEYIGQTLSILMRILAAENQWKLALSVAEKTISLLKRGNKNISLLCEVYNSALDICSIHGDTHTCEKLEKCVLSILMQLYSINNPIEFFAMAKLMSTLFMVKAKTDNITNAIRIGYKLYHLNYGLHAEIFQMETVPILADLLISAKRIEDATYAVGVTRNMMKNTLFAGESLYFIFCCDLLLDTSFYLEKIDAIEKFAEKIYLEYNTSKSNAITKKYLIICLLVYFTRVCNWNKVEKWKCYCDVPKVFKNDYNHVKFKLRFLELNLLQVARSLSSKNATDVVLEAEFKVIKQLVGECLALSKSWSFFLPKCYLYVGYHCKLTAKTKYKQYIKLGLKEAEVNGNLSTKCWINLNENYWNIGHNNFLLLDFPFVLWKKAREYTVDQWTQIMFPLPLP